MANFKHNNGEAIAYGIFKWSFFFTHERIFLSVEIDVRRFSVVNMAARW